MTEDNCEQASPCDSCELGTACSAKEKEEHERARLQERLFHIRHKIMVMSGKGGVGKSTVAINLATALAAGGHQVGIVDADLHGPDVARMLGIEGRHLTGRGDTVEPVEVSRGLKAVSMALLAEDPDNAIIWRGPLKHSAIKRFLGNVNWGDLDFLIVDLPPGTGDEPLSVARLIKEVDGAIIVTTPQDVALLDSRKAVNFSKLIKVTVLGIVENMSGMACPYCGENIDLFKIGGGEKAARELEVPFLGRIPIDPRVVIKSDSGQPFIADPEDSVVKTEFLKLVQRLLHRLKASEIEVTPAVQ